MTQFIFANNAATTLASTVSTGSTSITVASGGGSLFPTPLTGQQFALTLIPASSTTGLPNEIVYCTARSGDTMTIVRAREGTGALAFAIGDLVQNLWTAGQAAALAQVQDVQAQVGNWAQDTGTANAGVVTLSVPPLSLAYLKGVPIRVLKMASPNTGAYTLNVNNLGVTAVNYLGSALTNAALPGGQFFVVLYDGAVFEVMGVSITSASSLPPSGPAGGDLTGTYPNPTIGLGAVVANRIGAGAVTAPALGPASVGTVALANGAVTSAILGANSVTSAAIAPAAVTTSDVAPANITTALLANAAVTTAILAPNAVTNPTMATMAAGTFKSNTTGSAAIPADNPISGLWAILGFGYVAVQNAQPSGSSSGESLTGSAWNPRVLNAIASNSLGASLGTNVINIPAGTYYASASAWAVKFDSSGFLIHKMRIRGSGTTLVNGTNYGILGYAGTTEIGANATVSGFFTTAGAAISVESWVSSSGTGGGYGGTNPPASSGENEVYVSMSLFKLSN